MEIFKFGTDREDIGSFVSASLRIVCPSGDFLSIQTGLLPESQPGFREDRGTIDMIFTVRQLQDIKCQEQNADLHVCMTFFELT